MGNSDHDSFSDASKCVPRQVDQLVPTLVLDWQNTGARQTLRFIGESMRPFLLDGDRIVVQFGLALNISIGDIVLIRADHILSAHRIIDRITSKNETLYLEAGDNSLVGRLIRPGDSVGLVVARQRHGISIDLTHEEYRKCALKIAHFQCRALKLIEKIPSFPGRYRLLHLLKSLCFKSMFSDTFTE
ncbi:S24/S26 family peptidase [bacterium]|nr:S24/S26 family peptidase [bacterium]